MSNQFKCNIKEIEEYRDSLKNVRERFELIVISEVYDGKGKAAKAIEKDLLQIETNKKRIIANLEKYEKAITRLIDGLNWKVTFQNSEQFVTTQSMRQIRNDLKSAIYKTDDYLVQLVDDRRGITRRSIENDGWGMTIPVDEEERAAALAMFDRNNDKFEFAAEKSKKIMRNIETLIRNFIREANRHVNVLDMDTNTILTEVIGLSAGELKLIGFDLKSGDFYQTSKKFAENIDFINFIESKTDEKLSDEMIKKIRELSPNEKKLLLENITLLDEESWFGMSKNLIMNTIEIMILYPTRKLNAFSGQNTMELYRFLAEEAIYECFRPEFSKEAYALIHEKLKKLGIEIKPLPDFVGENVIGELDDGTKVVGEPLRIESAAGMQAMAIEINGEVVIIYEGSQWDGNNGETDWRDTNFIGSINPGVPQQSLDALQFAEKAMSYYKDRGIENFVVTGHSLAGGAGEYVGNKLDINSVGFDPAPNKEINSNYNKGVTVIPKGGMLNHVDIKDGVAVEDSNVTTIAGILCGSNTIMGVVKGVLTGNPIVKIIDTLSANLEFMDRNNPNQSTIANDKNGSNPNTNGIYLTNKDFNALDKIDGKEPTRPDDDKDPENGFITNIHISGSV